MHAGCWERITLICPRCRSEQGLALEQVYSTQGDFILEGILHCPASACRIQYPILAGVPIVLKDLPRWWRNAPLTGPVGNTPELRDYFAALADNDSARHEQRRLLSTYMDAHYGNNEEVNTALFEHQSCRYWERAVSLSHTESPYQRALDLGCSVGRYTFELAQYSELALGLDLNFEMLAVAAKIQRERIVRYDRAVRGLRFEPVERSFEAAQNVFFILADALDPPLQATDFDCVAALNLLDNVNVPLILIGQMDALLRSGGRLILGSPYEWRSELCESVEWLENADVDAAAMVRAIVTQNLFPQMQLNYQSLRDHAEVPWILRQHERAWRFFLVHLFAAQKG